MRQNWGSPLARSRRSARLLRVALVFSAVSGLSLGGCAVFQREPSASPVVVASPQAPVGQPELARFYTQRINWEACGPNQCGWLTVPIDYRKPRAGTIRLAVLKAPARGQRVGSLVVNPGGPGGSGVDYARAADQLASTAVRRSFDVVGFDPRGVARSAGVRCLDDRQLDAFLGSDPTPDDAVEQKAAAANARKLAQACQRRVDPKLLANLSTADAARDMDVLRSVLGEAQLTYLGKSYGTYLGAVYAGLFPQRVGRFVLDGALAPDLPAAEMNLDQAVGFDTATKAWAEDCVAQGGCPLGGSRDQVIDAVTSLLKQLDRTPMQVPGQPELTEGWGVLGVASAMYDQGSWGILTDAVVDARKGDGTALMELANRYAERNSDGTYSGNGMQAIFAVNCLDRPEVPGVPARVEAARRAAQAAPIWGETLAWGSFGCTFWPNRATKPPTQIRAAGSAAILVVGTTRDPATPYAWAQRLAKQLENARLLSFAGDGHTAYMRSNDCVNSVVDKLLLTGQAPAADVSC